MLGHVLVQVLHRLDVRVHPLDLAVGHEHHAVHALEDQLARGVVVDLARHGVEVELDLEAADGAEIDGQEVEEERALGLGGQGDHLPPRAGRHLVVDELEIGGLAAEPGPVVHQLAVDLARGVVDHRHACGLPQAPKSLSISSSASPRNSDRDARRARAVPIEHVREDLVELAHRRLDPELHQAQRGAVVEQHHEDDPPRHVRQVHRLASRPGGTARRTRARPSMRASWSLALKSAAVSEANAVGIERGRLADGGHHLPGAVHDQRGAGVGLAEKAAQDRLNRRGVFLPERPARGPAHRDLPSSASSVLPCRRTIAAARRRSTGCRSQAR